MTTLSGEDLVRRASAALGQIKLDNDALPPVLSNQLARLAGVLHEAGNDADAGLLRSVADVLTHIDGSPDGAAAVWETIDERLNAVDFDSPRPILERNPLVAAWECLRALVRPSDAQLRRSVLAIVGAWIHSGIPSSVVMLEVDRLAKELPIRP